MTLTSKKIWVTTFVVASLVLAVIVAGTIVAQSGTNLKDSLAPKEGDPNVVATVQGLDVTHGDIRRGGDFWTTVDPTVTKDAAIDKSIVGVIDGFVIEAEVKRRQLTPTLEETKAYMAPHRETCLASDECTGALQRLGFDPNSDAYWEEVGIPEYGKSLGEIRLFRAIIEDRNMEEADDATLAALRGTMIVELRNNANIEWHDEDLEQTYQEAVARE